MGFYLRRATLDRACQEAQWGSLLYVSCALPPISLHKGRAGRPAFYTSAVPAALAILKPRKDSALPPFTPKSPFNHCFAKTVNRTFYRSEVPVRLFPAALHRGASTPPALHTAFDVTAF